MASRPNKFGIEQSLPFVSKLKAVFSGFILQYSSFYNCGNFSIQSRIISDWLKYN